MNASFAIFFKCYVLKFADNLEILKPIRDFAAPRSPINYNFAPDITCKKFIS